MFPTFADLINIEKQLKHPTPCGSADLDDITYMSYVICR